MGIAEELERLAVLRQTGVLTEEEYVEAKRAVIGKGALPPVSASPTPERGGVAGELAPSRRVPIWYPWWATIPLCLILLGPSCSVATGAYHATLSNSLLGDEGHGGGLFALLLVLAASHGLPIGAWIVLRRRLTRGRTRR